MRRRQGKLISNLPQATGRPQREPILYICDFSRGGLNTRLYMLVSKPCSEVTNIGDRLSLRAVYWLQEQNQTPLLHSPHLTQKKLKTILCPVLILADTGDLIKREHIRWISYQILKSYLVFIKGQHILIFIKNGMALSFYKKIYKRERSTLKKKVLFRQYDQLTK